MSHLLLRGGRPWGSAAPADILVRNGVIETVGDGIEDPEAEVGRASCRERVWIPV